ncbi:MAG: PorP/SprF family type IX secretion system membrane protein [Bacteroidales bacterium]|nr:PorP/SprF family type IX secretion system membrane protein [Bacteroidales bacterium]
MKKIYIFLVIILSSITTYSQEIYFSQYYADKLSINPAFSGLKECKEINLILKHQWPNIGNGYKTYCASYIQNLNRCGIGFRTYGTSSGETFYNNYFAVSYSTKVKLTRRFRCSAGIEISYFNQKIKQNNLVYYSMIDPSNGNISGLQEYTDIPTNNLLDLSLGLMIFDNKTIASVAIYNIVNFDISNNNDRDNKIISALLSHKINIPHLIKNQKYETSYLIPSIIYRRQCSTNTIQAGIYLDSYPLIAGITYRIEKNEYKASAIIASIGISVKNIQIGYGHDFEISPIIKKTYGTHEIAVKYKLGNNKKNEGRQTILCPAF